MESYHKRKKALEEKYGKLITLKPFNDIAIVDRRTSVGFADALPAHRGLVENKQQKYVKQIQDILNEFKVIRIKQE